MIQKYSTPDVKITNQKFELYKEDGMYYLKIDFDYENEQGFYKGHADKVRFDLLLTGIEYDYNEDYRSKNAKAEFCVPTYDNYTTTCLFDILPGSNKNFFTIELVKEKVHEMTIEEIEKKFGHKIKIVSKSK